MIERLIDLAADRLGHRPGRIAPPQHDPAAAQPYANPLGLTYDSGDYPAAMETALALADWDGFAGAARRGAAARHAAAASASPIMSRSPAASPRERTEITVLPEGRVELVMGTMSSGQGHETSFAQLVTEWLGVPFDSIDYVAHDTARVAAGGGSHSGRSMKLADHDHRPGDRRHHRQGPQDRRRAAGSRRGRHRIRRTAASASPAPTATIGIFEVAAAAATRARPAGGAARAARGGVRPDPAGRELPLRRAGLRGRGRCRDRRGRDRRLCRGRRCRPRDQPADPARADAWRHRPGRRPGAARGQPLRSGDRPVAGGELHGLRDAARRRLSRRSPPR